MYLSIVVPTKNRQKQLSKLLFLWNKFFKFTNDIELIIFDTSDEISYHDDLPFNVNHIKGNSNYNVQESFENAWRNSKGEWIIYIGDDDFIDPNIVLKLRGLIADYNFDILHYPRSLYYWEDVEFDRKGMFFQPSTLVYNSLYSKSFQLVSISEELESFVRNGFRDLGGLPSVYHGLVRRSVFDSCEYQVFPGPSPDIAFTFNLISSGKNYTYAYFDFPLSIAGASGSSAAGMGRRGEHNLRFDALPSWLPDEITINWPEIIPKVWTGPTIYWYSWERIINKGSFLPYEYRRLPLVRLLRDNFWYNYLFVYRSLNDVGKIHKWFLMLNGLMLYCAFRIYQLLPGRIQDFIARQTNYYSNKNVLYPVNFENAVKFIKNYRIED